MAIGQAGGAGAAPSPTPNIVTQQHAGAAADMNGQMVDEKYMDKRNLALFNAASKWSKPNGTQTALEDLPKVKIAESSTVVDRWDDAIDSIQGEVPLQSLTGILRELFADAFANKCKKLLLVSDKGQILMTRRGLGAEMYAHIEGEENYKKEMHRSIDDNLTLSVLRALYRDNTVQKFLPLNGAVGRGPAADDMPDDTDASDNMGSRPGSRRGSGPGYESGSESESELDSGAIFSGVQCHFLTSPDAVLCHRLPNEPGVDVNEDHIQNDASGFDVETFNRDAGLTEERNALHSNFGSAEQIIQKQIVSPAASELRVDTSSPVEPINDSDSANDSLIYVELTITPENVATTMTTIDGGVDTKITELPSPPTSPAPAVIPLDNEARDVHDARYRKNLASFDARPKAQIDYKNGLVIPEEVTRL